MRQVRKEGGTLAGGSPEPRARPPVTNVSAESVPPPLKQYQRTLSIPTKGRGLVDVTRPVGVVVTESGIATGLATVFIRHTSASLVIQENADPAVLRDMEKWIERLAPEGSHYEHDDEGPDDMPAHLRSTVTRSSEAIPVAGGRLALGTWQALYVWEHRHVGHRRELVVHLIGL